MRRTLAPPMLSLSLLLSACGTPPAPPPPDAAPEVAPVAAADGARVDYQAELRPAPPGDLSTFQPPARGAYPEGPFGEAVRRGEALFMDTPGHAGQYTGNPLSCSNCHLDGGRLADSGPMWAAWIKYPAYRQKNDHVNSMEERLRGCFTYSLNAQASPAGHAPEPGDPLLTDLESYLYWLSTGAPVGATLPGRGYPTLEAPPEAPDAGRGAAVYAARCETCHGADGQGARAEDRLVFPPLWGPDSYNWGAGMHRTNTAAGFIWANMPLGQPRSLSTQEAWDVAAFVNSHPRPADPRGKDVAATDAAFHSHDCSYGETVEGHLLGQGKGQ